MRKCEKARGKHELAQIQTLLTKLSCTFRPPPFPISCSYVGRLAFFCGGGSASFSWDWGDWGDCGCDDSLKLLIGQMTVLRNSPGSLRVVTIGCLREAKYQLVESNESDNRWTTEAKEEAAAKQFGCDYACALLKAYNNLF